MELNTTVSKLHLKTESFPRCSIMAINSYSLKMLEQRVIEYTAFPSVRSLINGQFITNHCDQTDMYAIAYLAI